MGVGFQCVCVPVKPVPAAVREALRGRNAVAAASAVAFAIAASATANAQAQIGSEKSQTVEEIVVTGIREQLQTSQARKQEAEEIVDSITAVEIGALPDRSVTEVLQRIPGVAIGRVPEPRDADRIAVEGSGVTVRGLAWVRSELNGRSAFSAKNSRTSGFEDVPPELMAAVDVFKNPSAAMIEGGLSGTVDLRTRLPFDSAEPRARLLRRVLVRVICRKRGVPRDRYCTAIDSTPGSASSAFWRR